MTRSTPIAQLKQEKPPDSNESELVNEILKSAGKKDVEVIFDPTKPTAIPIRTVDTSKAKEILGFEPTISLQDGIYDTVSWYGNYISNRQATEN